MRDFWTSSGFVLLDRTDDGHLVVTDDFLRAYLMRPEIRPVDDSCDAERALHADLVANPRAEIDSDRVQTLADSDARGNYAVVLDFRDRLVAAKTVEACYLAQFRAGPVAIPPLFLDHMAHVIMRNILDGTEYPLQARAAELFFREQIATIQEGTVLLGDSETVRMLAATAGMGDLGRLVVEAGTPAKRVELDVLSEETAGAYWDRDERFDTVIDITFTRPGLDALARVLERWVGHMLGAGVRIQPVQKIVDERWRWHVGLDTDATAMLNDLYQGTEMDNDRLGRLLSLFQLEFDDDSLMDPDVAGRPVYLGLAMNEDKKVRLKPQNLLMNLPLAPEA